MELYSFKSKCEELTDLLVNNVRRLLKNDSVGRLLKSGFNVGRQAATIHNDISIKLQYSCVVIIPGASSQQLFPHRLWEVILMPSGFLNELVSSRM